MNITELKKTFEEHHKTCVKEKEQRRLLYRQEYGEDPPDYPGENFSLASSLAFMCECIEELMKENEQIEKSRVDG